MDFKEIYKQKLTTADEAVKLIEDNWNVAVPVAVGQPPTLINALARRKNHYTNLGFLAVVDVYPTEMSAVEKNDGILLDFSYCVVNREGLQSGKYTYTPARLSQVPQFYDTGRYYNATMLQAAPMDEYGYFSMGLSCDYILPFSKQAQKVIVQVNENMPRTFGRNFLHVTEIDAIVESSTPLAALPIIPPNKNETLIGQYIADLVEDGSCIQLGIGGIPNAAALALENKKDLGIHTEMFADSMKVLWEKGVINNRKKNFNPDIMIATFALGSNDLYKWLNNNPAVHFYPTDWVNTPANIGRNDKMIAINSGLQVDLTGQVNAESIGPKQYTHVGGQQDYIMGSFISKGGKGIIAMESQAMTKEGPISKIVPHLTYGSFVSTGRNDTQYVITEYGVAYLKAANIRSRVKQLINIAHPDYRDQLRFEAQKANFI